LIFKTKDNTKSILVLSPKKIDKVYKSVYFSEKKPEKTEISTSNKTSVKVGFAKKTRNMAVIKENPYYQEIKNHKKILGKSQSNKEITTKML